jgi:hypothetical protein
MMIMVMMMMMMLLLMMMMKSHLIYLFFYLWFYSPCGPWQLFQILYLYTVEKPPWKGISPSYRRHLHTVQHNTE